MRTAQLPTNPCPLVLDIEMSHQEQLVWQKPKQQGSHPTTTNKLDKNYNLPSILCHTHCLSSWNRQQFKENFLLISFTCCNDSGTEFRKVKIGNEASSWLQWDSNAASSKLSSLSSLCSCFLLRPTIKHTVLLQVWQCTIVRWAMQATSSDLMVLMVEKFKYLL